MAPSSGSACAPPHLVPRKARSESISIPLVCIHYEMRASSASLCTGSFSFRDPRLSVFSLPLRRGRARVGVKAGGVPRLCFSPPIPTFLRQGEGAEGPGIRSHASLGQHTLQGLLQHLPAELP